MFCDLPYVLQAHLHLELQQHEQPGIHPVVRNTWNWPRSSPVPPPPMPTKSVMRHVLRNISLVHQPLKARKTFEVPEALLDCRALLKKQGVLLLGKLS